jgi:hypothetical protein
MPEISIWSVLMAVSPVIDAVWPVPRLLNKLNMQTSIQSGARDDPNDFAQPTFDGQDCGAMHE